MAKLENACDLSSHALEACRFNSDWVYARVAERNTQMIQSHRRKDANSNLVTCITPDWWNWKTRQV